MAAGIAEGRRVLVVEDEFTIVLLIEDALLDLGIQVIGFTVGCSVVLSQGGAD